MLSICDILSPIDTIFQNTIRTVRFSVFALAGQQIVDVYRHPVVGIFRQQRFLVHVIVGQVVCGFGQVFV